MDTVVRMHCVDYVHLMSDDHDIGVVIAILGLGPQRLSVLLDQLYRVGR